MLRVELVLDRPHQVGAGYRAIGAGRGPHRPRPGQHGHRPAGQRSPSGQPSAARAARSRTGRRRHRGRRAGSRPQSGIQAGVHQARTGRAGHREPDSRLRPGGRQRGSARRAAPTPRTTRRSPCPPAGSRPQPGGGVPDMVTAGEPGPSVASAADSSPAIRSSPLGHPGRCALQQDSDPRGLRAGPACGGTSSCTADGTSVEFGRARPPHGRPRHRWRPELCRPELRRHVRHRGRQRVQPERHLGDQAQRPLRAAEQLAQVVAGHVLDHLAARVRDRRRPRGRS